MDSAPTSPRDPLTTRRGRRLMIWFGGAGVLLLLLATRYGIGLTPDSVDYVSAARGLLAGRGFVNEWGSVYHHWPPLLPMVLAFLRLLTRDLLGIDRYVQALGFGLMVAMGVRILHEDLRSRWVPLAGGLLLLVSPPILVMSSELSSEALYIVLGVAIVYLYPRATASGRMRDLLWIAVPAGLAGIQRYAGVAFILAVCLFLLLDERTAGLRARLRRAVFFGATASAPLALWFVRNLIATGTLTGRRPASHYAFGATLLRGLREPGSWWLPAWLGPVVPVVLIAGLFLILLVALVPESVTPGRLPRLPARIRLAGWMALVHIAVMVAAMMHTGLSPLGLRYLSPAAPGLILLLVGVADLAATRPGGRSLRLVGISAAGLLLAACVSTSSVRVGHLLHRVATNRALTPLSGARWRESPILAWVRGREGDPRPVFTNSMRLVRFYGDPPRLYLRSLDQVETQIQKHVPGDYVLLDYGRWGWQRAQVSALATRHPALVRLRGPEGVALTVGPLGHR